jgi:glycosyltransferase involved in cell wall biosynthesis
MQISQPDIELHIYGSGKFVKKLLEYQKKDIRIKYKGVVTNEEIIVAEQEASLLVNPRYSNQEFVKYSFPSKTSEYMLSGTPVLTTKLSGIPEEYFQYLYTFDDETIEGYAHKLNEILSLPHEELKQKGLKAQEFVLKNKNNIIQSQRIELFFKTIIAAH